MWHWSVLWPILKWIRESRNLRILWILATSYNLSLQSSSQQLWERTLGSLLFTKHSISFVDICTWNIFLWDSKEHVFFFFLFQKTTLQIFEDNSYILPKTYLLPVISHPLGVPFNQLPPVSGSFYWYKQKPLVTWWSHHILFAYQTCN